ncbi:DUF2164 domain-containing protein [Crassaminicella profunda]|uniref:DUF2164 domain-containing protein n=1 Tax=Crassaminicella profunda TaxID=1286698 RepID=UPI001CA7229E|nr:DUF2164 domain-containing protein [Crassaminicella profunda]QZY56925.1 DUF2164 domain-containing protein [Crassaminicella profunda]
MNEIKLTKDRYEDAVEEIRRYFECEREESIGNLQGQLILDFIIEKIGPHIYNQAISDMQKYMNDKVDDMYAYMI